MAEANSPKMPSPDTFPLPRLPKKFPNISMPLPPVMFRRKVPTPPQDAPIDDTDWLTSCRLSPALSAASAILFVAFPAISSPLSTASSPTSRSAAARTTGLSFTSFSQARYPMPPPITAVLVAFPNPASVRWGCTSAPPILRAVVCVAEWLATFLPIPKIVDHFPIVVLIVFI